MPPAAYRNYPVSQLSEHGNASIRGKVLTPVTRAMPLIEGPAIVYCLSKEYSVDNEMINLHNLCCHLVRYL